MSEVATTGQQYPLLEQANEIEDLLGLLVEIALVRIVADETIKPLLDEKAVS